MYRQTLRAMNAQEKREKERRKQMKVYRTTEGTVFEVVCGILCIAFWAIELLSMSRSGVADAGDLIGLVAITGAVVAMLVSAYHPYWLNTADEHIENSRQLALLVQSVRVLALGLATFFLILSLKDLYGWQLPEWTKYISIGLFVGIPLTYTILIRRAK